MRFHAVNVQFKVSVPEARVDQFDFNLEMPGWCRKKCDWTYAPHICGCHIAYREIEKGVSKITRRIANDILVDGFDGLVEGCDGCSVEVNFDVASLFNAVVSGVNVKVAALDGMCTLLNGCGGKGLPALVESGRPGGRVVNPT